MISKEDDTMIDTVVQRVFWVSIVIATLVALVMVVRVKAGAEEENTYCADFTSDAQVRTDDILAVVGYYFTPDGDLDGDGTTRVADIILTVQDYFHACTVPTIISTPYDFGTSEGDPPPGWTHQSYAADIEDDGLPNHSNGGTAGSTGALSFECKTPGSAANIDFDTETVTCSGGGSPPEGFAGHANGFSAWANDWTYYGFFQGRGHGSATGGNLDNIYVHANWRYCHWNGPACTWTYGGVYDQEACSYCMTLQSGINNNVPLPPYLNINCRQIDATVQAWEHIGQTQPIAVRVYSNGECR